MVGSLISDNALIQYSHNFTSAIFSNLPIYSHQLNNVGNNIDSGNVYDKDYIGMSSDAAISYNLGTLKPNEKKEFSLIMCMQYDVDKDIETIKEKVDELKNIDINKELTKIKNSWKRCRIK